MEYTLSDLARITGAKRRALQLWAEAGVLHTDDVHGGRGAHRKYSRDEAIVACVMTYLANMQISIGMLVKVAGVFRSELLPKIRDSVDLAIIDTKVVYLIVQDRADDFKMHAVGCNRDDPEDKKMDVDRTIGRLATEHLHEPESGTIVMLLNTHLSALR
ncbi:MerR family transcriptional regulator [Mesorhizobium sp. M0955]|uniref:MerR family transcriptional regulator n=1 Tax=Mesorhizobium sp. M0955 TaxID=2957033 RepID=UPI0033390806